MTVHPGRQIPPLQNLRTKKFGPALGLAAASARDFPPPPPPLAGVPSHCQNFRPRAQSSYRGSPYASTASSMNPRTTPYRPDAPSCDLPPRPDAGGSCLHHSLGIGTMGANATTPLSPSAKLMCIRASSNFRGAGCVLVRPCTDASDSGLRRSALRILGTYKGVERREAWETKSPE